MKQFLVFAGSDYYPEGGWHDFVRSFDSKDDAIMFVAQKRDGDWWHIVDTKTGMIVANSA